MWVNRRKYELIQRMAENNEHDANIIRSIASSLKTNSLLMNEQMVVMTHEHYDNLVHEKNTLADQVISLTEERDLYKQRWQSLLYIRGKSENENRT